MDWSQKKRIFLTTYLKKPFLLIYIFYKSDIFPPAWPWKAQKSIIFYAISVENNVHLVILKIKTLSIQLKKQAFS